MKPLYLILALAVGSATAVGQSDRWKIDVPAIEEEYGTPGVYACDMGACTWITDDPKNPKYTTKGFVKRRTRKTCADKTRILLTAEDGSKHCVRFPEPGEVRAD